MSSFDRLDRLAPRIPSNTCPSIDRSIKQIDDACEALSALTAHKGELEALRASNEALRDVGIFWRETAKEECAQVDDLEDHLAKITAERDELLASQQRNAA